MDSHHPQRDHVLIEAVLDALVQVVVGLPKQRVRLARSRIAVAEQNEPDLIVLGHLHEILQTGAHRALILRRGRICATAKHVIIVTRNYKYIWRGTYYTLARNYTAARRSLIIGRRAQRVKRHGDVRKLGRRFECVLIVAEFEQIGGTEHDRLNCYFDDDGVVGSGWWAVCCYGRVIAVHLKWYL